MKGIVVKISFIILFFFSSFSLFPESNYWHYYQLNFDGLGNCGPACIAMVYTYHTGNLIHLDKVNKLIVYKGNNGATNMQSLHSALLKLEIPNEIVSIKDFILSDYLYIINIDTKYILNREYSYEGGHYIVLFDYFDGWYKVNDSLHPKKEFVWYYGEDIKMALKHNYAIKVEKWKSNK